MLLHAVAGADCVGGSQRDLGNLGDSRGGKSDGTLAATTVAASTPRSASRSVAGADYFEVAVDKDVVGPVDADVMDLVVAAA
jgi:hypothetical protein